MAGEGGDAGVAVVAGVGPGLGAALVRQFAGGGYRVGMIARSKDYLRQLQQEIGKGDQVLPVRADMQEAKEVSTAFSEIRDQLGPVDVLVNHASASAWKGVQEVSPGEFEHAWRVTVYGALLCLREVVEGMVERGRGAVLFTGATSAVRGRGGAVDFTSAKYALRGLAEASARELWPKGVHVAHVIIDGMIDTPRVREKHDPGPEEPLLLPEEIAETYWHLAHQKPSAWSWEVDVRPSREAFFE